MSPLITFGLDSRRQRADARRAIVRDARQALSEAASRALLLEEFLSDPRFLALQRHLDGRAPMAATDSVEGNRATYLGWLREEVDRLEAEWKLS